MVGLVIVTHSPALSRALAELVRQVSAESIPLAAVGGVGENREAFGTDALDIAAAIDSIYSDAGVVVLMDLGSAVLSAETALELLPADRQSRVRLCAAPLVEGAVAAGVQIGLDSDLESVCREAARALSPKARHLGGSGDERTVDASAAPEPTAPADRPQIVLAVNTPHGLHARPAARFVRTAAAFDARVWVKKVGSPLPAVPALSLNSLATLGVGRGDRIAVSAAGAQAREVLRALGDLVNRELQAAPESPAPSTVRPGPDVDTAGGIRGIPLSDGTAMGPSFRLRHRAAWPPAEQEQSRKPEQEWADLMRAMDLAGEVIQKRRDATAAGAGEAEAAIFDAHLLILRDPLLLERARQRIFEKGQTAARAWQEPVAEFAAGCRVLPDPYLRQRGDDVEDVGREVLRGLRDAGGSGVIELPQSGILVARELTPTDVADLDPDRVLGIVTVAGGPTSHAAILARALGIPAIAVGDSGLPDLPPETPLGLDGCSGTLWIRPSADRVAQLEAQRSRWLQERRRQCLIGRGPAATRDGRRIAVAANIGSLPEAAKARECGADGIGLLRTEFLFLQRSRPPDEADQVDALTRIVRAVGKRPICVRTLDAGGDKPMPYLDLPVEANPCLGLRAVRLCLRHPEILRPQLRAVLRAGDAGDVRLLFPMISRVEEVDRLLAVRDEIHRDLAGEGIAHRWPIPTGIMIETPAAVLLMPSFAGRLDFFSIGTNDLTQYTLAAERGNAELADYADPLHPVILRLIGQVVSAAHRHGKPVTVCGEMAADPAAVPVLVGLGVDELSMAPDAVPRVKAVVRELTVSAAAGLAEKVCARDTASETRRMAREFREKY